VPHAVEAPPAGCNQRFGVVFAKAFDLPKAKPNGAVEFTSPLL
jgi:hypothetical protein